MKARFYNKSGEERYPVYFKSSGTFLSVLTLEEEDKDILMTYNQLWDAGFHSLADELESYMFRNGFIK